MSGAGDQAEKQTPGIFLADLQESPLSLADSGASPSASGLTLEVSSPSASFLTGGESSAAKPTVGSSDRTAAKADDANKDALEDFDLQSRQLKEELSSFKASLAQAARVEGTPDPSVGDFSFTQKGSLKSTPAGEGFTQQTQYNPLHARSQMDDADSDVRADADQDLSSEYSGPESPRGSTVSDFSSASPSLLGSPAKHSPSQSLETLKRALRNNGFALKVRGEDDANKISSVVSTFFSVLQQYERRGKLIQEMLASNEMSTRQEHKLESKIRRMKTERDEARRELATMSDKFQSQLERSMSESRKASEGKQKMGSEKDKIQGKVEHLEHALRARNKEVDHLKQKLKERDEREARKQTRDKGIYDKLKKKVARQNAGTVAAAARELRPAEIVGIYESQREVLESEITALRTDLHATKSRLEEKEQYILNKDMAGNWKTPAEGEMLNSLAASQKASADAVRKLAEFEVKATEAARTAAKDIAEERRKNHVLAEENAGLILELESRPQTKDLQAAQRYINMLQKEMAKLKASIDSQQYKGAAGPEATKDTASRMRRDRKVFQLGLHKVHNVPHSILVQIVQDACIKVELDDPTLLSQSMAKLLRIVAAVPKMERFVGAVCEAVLQDGVNFIPQDVREIPDPKEVPRVLQHWLSELKKLHDLQIFFDALLRELQHRSTTSKQKGKSTSAALMAIKEMLVAERAFHQMRATFENANQILNDNPDELLSKVVAHFQRLFNCPQLEGTFAAINQAYLTVTESKNFLKALRNLIGLDRNAGVNACLARIRQLVILQAKSFSDAGKQGGSAEQAWVLELAKLLDAKDAEDVFGKVKEIVRIKEEGEAVKSEYKEVIEELYDVLSVNTVGEIVGAAKKLAG